MIDLHEEVPTTLAAATRLPQLRRNGRPPHVAQMYRWCQNGLKGIKLESVMVAGSRCTTSDAVDRWLAALNGEAVARRTRTHGRRQIDHERAEKELQASGW